MNNAEKIKNELAKYIVVLRDSWINCHRTEDRPLYEKHLAFAAIMFAEVQIEFPLTKLKQSVETERHRYGTSYLSNAEGLAAESAFHKFATFIEDSIDE